MITEDEARRALAGERATILVQVIKNAFATYQKQGNFHKPSTRAHMLSDYMGQEAKKLFAPLDGVRSGSEYASDFFVVDEKFTIQFKKHDRRTYLTKNYRTDRQKKIYETGVLEGMPDLAHIYCGYTLNLTESNYKELVVTRRVGETVEWRIDLGDLAAGTLAPIAPIFEGLPEEFVSLPRIVRKSKEAESSE